jgi:hypothetical protein
MARARRISAAVLGVSLLGALTGCSTPSRAAKGPPTSATAVGKPTSSTFVSTVIPHTAAGDQLRWLLGAVATLPLSRGVIDGPSDLVELTGFEPATYWLQTSRSAN